MGGWCVLYLSRHNNKTQGGREYTIYALIGTTIEERKRALNGGSTDSMNVRSLARLNDSEDAAAAAVTGVQSTGVQVLYYIHKWGEEQRRLLWEDMEWDFAFVILMSKQ